MATEAEISAINAVSEKTLRQNWREGVRDADGVRFAYTCPSPSHYPWQWYWDSCFAAIAWRHFDPDRSQRELRSLLAAQRQDGFIGHTIFWNHQLGGVRRFTYNVTERHPRMTASIQPPALAWAWRAIGGDPAGEPAIVRHYDWLAEHRDLDGDGLLWIVQPDESGLDASPMFDSIWGSHAHGLSRFVLLVRRNRHLGYDLKRIDAAGGPVCCEVLTNVLYSLSLSALGKPSLTDRIVERMYDADSGLFLPLARPEPKRRPATTWAALSPLALPDLPEAIGRRLVEQYLLDPKQFWLPLPPASVSATDPGFQPGEVRYAGIKRYWRGATWINSAWLLWLGLVRLGYQRQADELAQRVTTTVTREGLREYYNPYTGGGLGALDFAWSSLVMELTRPDPAARGSYL
jgi:hypothetical protein